MQEIFVLRNVTCLGHSGPGVSHYVDQRIDSACLNSAV